ncbi:MAG: hypothetical protein ABFC89_06465 [Methanospirillum sp.]
MDLDDLHRPVHDKSNPVAFHPIASSPVPGEVLRMPRRVDELQPLGDAEKHGPALASNRVRPQRTAG